MKLEDLAKHEKFGPMGKAFGHAMEWTTLERVFETAWEKNQPFAICQRHWEHLLSLGFTEIDRKCTLSWFYADCCRKHERIDLGLGVLDPLLAELKEMKSAPNAPRALKRFCKYQLDNLGKLRAALEALRTVDPLTP